MTEFRAHSNRVRTVDADSDHANWTACIWSLSTGERLVDCFAHWNTTTQSSLRNFHPTDVSSQLLHARTAASSSTSQFKTLAWANDDTQLFVSSRDGNIHCLDASTGTTLSKWPIHTRENAGCIAALETNGTLIAASTGSCIAPVQRTVHELRDELANSQRVANEQKDSLNDIIRSLRANLYGQKTSSNEHIINLEETTQHFVTSSPTLNTPSIRRRTVSTQPSTPFVPFSTHEMNAQTTKSHISKKLTRKFAFNLPSPNEMPTVFSVHTSRDVIVNPCILKVAYMMLQTLLEMENTINEIVRADKLIIDWLAASEFTDRCVMMLERVGDEPSNAEKRDEAVAAYSAALSLAHKALSAAAKILEGDGRLTEAVQCFQKMQNELQEDTGMMDERAQWEDDFRERCVEKLEMLGDTARDSKKHDEAIGYYSHALLLDPTNVKFLLKRSNELRIIFHIIELDPSTHRGYDGKHAALHHMGRHSEALEAFTTMLSRLEQSHIAPTGKASSSQATAFEELPIYDKLRSSMTTGLDHSRIEREVKKYYRYVMFSRKWEDGEPLFRNVQNISIYDLESSFPNIKLQKLCRLIHSLGFQWIWIWSHSQQPGDLRKIIWNTCAWTYQEYVAAKTVQFYTEDWKPYLDLGIFNHKESPAIISEMEQPSGISSQELVLRPGLQRVREKLLLASMRQTTLVEDIAYLLLGIFDVSIPVIYGEGNRAVGRFLEHILTGSGDVTILAWTGRAGSYNSCLPMDLTVYNHLVAPHVPKPMETSEMYNMVAALRSSSPELSLAVALHARLSGNKLPSPSMTASRLQLAILASDTDPDTHVFRATTAALGDIEAKTTDDQSGMEDFILIHPWISPLRRYFSRRTPGLDDTTRTAPCRTIWCAVI
ncbi:hypothetical protein OG21DRAFT_1527654 [Imleria badia]|nr:hypothetical protein OG21DRAFT_1527654 [Imleria badia]